VANCGKKKQLKDHGERIALEKFRQTSSDAVIEWPMQISGDEEELDSCFVRGDDCIRRSGPAEAEWADSQAGFA